MSKQELNDLPIAIKSDPILAPSLQELLIERNQMAALVLNGGGTLSEAEYRQYAGRHSGLVFAINVLIEEAKKYSKQEEDE